MKLQKLLSQVRQAVDDYNLINDNDYIAIGMSGGKDSLTLLSALRELKRFYPKHFTLCAIMVDLGFEDFEPGPVRHFCKEKEVPLYVVKTDISKIVFESHKDIRPCSLCAKLRKGALNEKALELGCNKIAYAHHKDDFIETMMLSLIFEGRFYSFPPAFHLDKTNLQVIRPLMYVSECDIIGFKNKANLPVITNPCPVDGYTKRQYVKELIRQMNLDNPGVKERLFHAVINGKIEDWPVLSAHITN